MTIKQKQHLLAYLGYYTADVDGIWGDLSRRATEAFQRDYQLTVDGLFGEETQTRILEVIASGETPAVDKIAENGVTVDKDSMTTGTFWDEIKYFTRGEPGIACPCGRCGGYPVEPVERLMLNADATREHFGKPMIPSSTVRCAAHNAELPGSAANSLHMRGKAMDFAIPGVSSATLVAYIKNLPEVDEAYPIDNSYVHMGVQKY